MSKIHYIDTEWNSKYIIAISECGKHWKDIDDSTSIKELVTCKKCLNKLNYKINKL